MTSICWSPLAQGMRLLPHRGNGLGGSYPTPSEEFGGINRGNTMNTVMAHLAEGCHAGTDREAARCLRDDDDTGQWSQPVPS